MFDRLASLMAGISQLFDRLFGLLAGLFRPLRPLFDRASAATRPLRERWHAFYDKREPREKLLLRLAGSLLGILFVYNFIYMPISDLGSGLDDLIDARRRDLIEIKGLMQSYDSLNRRMSSAQSRTLAGGPNFSLFSVLEQTLTTTAGRDRIGSINPSQKPVAGGFQQYSVDIKLTGISLQQIVDTLYGVQSLSMPITVSHLEIHEQAQNRRSFDVDMTCTALGKDASAGH